MYLGQADRGPGVSVSAVAPAPRVQRGAADPHGVPHVARRAGHQAARLQLQQAVVRVQADGEPARGVQGAHLQHPALVALHTAHAQSPHLGDDLQRAGGRELVVRGAEAGAAVQVNVRPHAEIVQRVREEYPLVLGFT